MWICGDQRLWWSFGDGTSEFGSVGDGLHDCSVAGSVMVGGWIVVWWWVSVAGLKFGGGFQ